MKPLTENSIFIVKESAGINLFIALFLFCVSATYYAYMSNGQLIDPMGIFSFAGAVIFMIKAFRQKQVIKINKDGIYFYGEHITSWNKFSRANIIQLPYAQTSDNNEIFILKITYCKEEQDALFEQQVRLHSNLNKSEEEIIEAIKAFTWVHKKMP